MDCKSLCRTFSLKGNPLLLEIPAAKGDYYVTSTRGGFLASKVKDQTLRMGVSSTVAPEVLLLSLERLLGKPRCTIPEALNQKPRFLVMPEDQAHAYLGQVPLDVGVLWEGTRIFGYRGLKGALCFKSSPLLYLGPGLASMAIKSDEVWYAQRLV